MPFYCSRVQPQFGERPGQCEWSQLEAFAIHLLFFTV